MQSASGTWVAAIMDVLSLPTSHGPAFVLLHRYRVSRILGCYWTSYIVEGFLDFLIFLYYASLTLGIHNTDSWILGVRYVPLCPESLTDVGRHLENGIELKMPLTGFSLTLIWPIKPHFWNLLMNLSQSWGIFLRRKSIEISIDLGDIWWGIMIRDVVTTCSHDQENMVLLMSSKTSKQKRTGMTTTASEHPLSMWEMLPDHPRTSPRDIIIGSTHTYA